MKCTTCAAELPIHTPICPYCGTRNDMDLRGVHEYTTHKPESERICPTCDIPMQTIDISAGDQHFFIEKCDRCQGLFFDPGELEAIMDETVNDTLTIDHD